MMVRSIRFWISERSPVLVDRGERGRTVYLFYKGTDGLDAFTLYRDC